MDYFGINSADDLPKIKEVLANQIMEGTVINHTEFEPASTLAVTDNGELVEDIATSEDGNVETENEEATDIVSPDLETSSPSEDTENNDFSIEETASNNETDVESAEEDLPADDLNEEDESTSPDEQQ